MNATEHLVEVYYRQRGHFTATDVKVINGNNRQFDILTFDPRNQSYNHIEVSVTHTVNSTWIRPLSVISDEVRFKFFGIPKNKRPDNPNTDFSKGKTYLEQIKSTYATFGIDYETVRRVWCTWCLPDNDIQNIENWKQKMAYEFQLKPGNFEILLFRDEVLKVLLDNIGTSNYDDEILRTLSLISEYRKQNPHF